MSKGKISEWGGLPTELEFKTEQQLSKACFQWFDKTFGADLRGMLVLNFNNPANPREGNMLKAQGLRAGFPDMSLHTPKVLHIELKLDNGVLSKQQVAQMEKLKSWGHSCAVVCSLEAFKRTVLDSLHRSGIMTPNDC